MSQFPPQPPSPQSMPPAAADPAPVPSKTNAAAVASLVCGLLACVPFLTGLAAIVLGVLGIKKARDPRAGGKGLAVAGLILGVLSLGGWTLFGGGVYRIVKGTSAERELAKQFINDVAAGNAEAALAQTDGSIARDDIQGLTQTVQSWGALNELRIVGLNYTGGRCEMKGLVRFGQTDKQFEMVLIEQGEDVWKVNGLHFK